ncbi:MAG: hypothetical protein AAF490_21985 [Chloroflexota bacterium]
MIQANNQIGDEFNIQFVWQLPDKGDYIRAILKAEVLSLDETADKYVVKLNELVAGRQEAPDGEPRQQAEYAKPYWALVGQIIGKKVAVAYESEDGRPLRLRLSTLTGEHQFFYRYDEGSDS